MAGTSLIHVRIEHSEAVKSKSDFLTTEASLLKINKAIKKYHLLRVEELKSKTKLHRKLKEFNTEIGKLQTNLPKIKIPDLAKFKEVKLNESKDVIEKKIKNVKNKHYDSDIENQLADIKAKLKELQSA